MTFFKLLKGLLYLSLCYSCCKSQNATEEPIMKTRCTGKDLKCYFPRSYKGKSYTDCIPSIVGSWTWCYTTADTYDYGYCADSCPNDVQLNPTVTSNKPFTVVAITQSATTGPSVKAITAFTKGTDNSSTNSVLMPYAEERSQTSPKSKITITEKEPPSINSNTERTSELPGKSMAPSSRQASHKPPTNYVPSYRETTSESSTYKNKGIEARRFMSPATMKQSAAQVISTRDLTTHQSEIQDMTTVKTSTVDMSLAISNSKENTKLSSGATVSQTTPKKLYMTTTTHSMDQVFTAISTKNITGSTPTSNNRITSVLLGIVIAAIVLAVCGVAMCMYKRRSRERATKTPGKTEAAIPLEKTKPKCDDNERVPSADDALLPSDEKVPTVTCVTSSDSGFGSNQKF